MGPANKLRTFCIQKVHMYTDVILHKAVNPNAGGIQTWQ
jgi:hypothetical protein